MNEALDQRAAVDAVRTRAVLASREWHGPRAGFEIGTVNEALTAMFHRMLVEHMFP